MQKLLLIDKYGLPETKKACFTSSQLVNRSFIQGLEKKPEYKKISDKLKIELLEKSIDSLTGIIFCRRCMRETPGYCMGCDTVDNIVRI